MTPAESAAVARVCDALVSSPPAVLGLAVAQFFVQAEPVQLRALFLAVELAEQRAPWLVDDYPGGRWHRQNELIRHTEVMRRRYPPNGDRAEWIRYGPAGPPAAVEREVA